MKKDYGIRLGEILRKQRDCFIRTADNTKINGGKIITNPILYYSLENEAFELQRKIGRENKKIIIAECKKRGITIPNFRKEGIKLMDKI